MLKNSALRIYSPFHESGKGARGLGQLSTLGLLALIITGLILAACGDTPTQTAPVTTSSAPNTTAAATTTSAANTTTVASATTKTGAASSTPTIVAATTAAVTTAAPNLPPPPTATAVAVLPTIGNTYPAGPAPTAAPPTGGLTQGELQVPDEFRKGVFATPRSLTVPKGFSVSVYAQLQNSPRFMATSPDGVVFVSENGGGKVVMLKDKGNSAERVVFAEGLDGPHGLAFYEVNGTTYLYVAENTRVLRFPYTPGQTQANKKETIVGNIPGGGNHRTRTVVFGKDGKMYVSIGSTCNVCVETDQRRAAIVQYNPDGTGERIYALGLRNAVGLAINPVTGELWETENSRDNIGDNMPPEEINIVKDGGNYGWPYCISNGVYDKDFGQRDQAFCDTTVKPALPMQAHSAPLGISFYSGKQFPTEFQNDAFVGFHGSWNRAEKTGYKVVRIRVQNGRPTTYEDFVTGWLVGGNAWGRPVMPMPAPDGSLLITDDSNNAVYKVSYTGG